ARNDPQLQVLKFDTLNEHDEYNQPDSRVSQNSTRQQNPKEKHEERVIAITNALRSNTNIKVLDFKKCSLSAECTATIIAFIKTNNTIKELNLYGTTIDEYMTKAATTLTSLLVTPFLSPLVALSETKNATFALAELIRNNNTLEKLNIGYTGITSEDACIIFNALKYNTTLREVYMDSNHIRSYAKHSLADLLSSTNLKVLSLSNNYLSDELAIAIAPSITQNSSMELLVLSGNHEIKESGKLALECATQANDHINIDLIGHNDASCVIM
ncbi:MAG: hypothetical protein SFT91_02755, partial [Rickettsiaceae bacterium]|nr:hypothetical protein [Rickettsiaceae bacterium]